MAHSLSARKRIRQNLKRRLRNKQIKVVVRGQTKKLRHLLAEQVSSKTKKGSSKPSKIVPKQIQQELQKTCRILDKAVASGIFHRGKSNRLKSRLSLAANKVL